MREKSGQDFAVADRRKTDANSVVSVGNFDKFNYGKNVDSFGDFDLAVDQKDSLNPQSSMVFDLTLVSGTWSSAADVLTLNGDGYLAAAHVITPDGKHTGHAAGNGVAGGFPDRC